MKKIRIYIDMDGVLVQYPTSGKPESFLALPPIEGAIEAYNRLSERYDVYIASTAPWSNPQAWEDKRLWVEQNIGQNAHKRLILTHYKNLLNGEYLIDDRTANGAGEFEGELIQFGQAPYENWDQVVEYIESKN